MTITGLNLNRTLLAVWAPGRRLAGPARDLYAVATRSARRTRSPGGPGAAGHGQRAREAGLTPAGTAEQDDLHASKAAVQLTDST